jgi:hypothetical protein
MTLREAAMKVLSGHDGPMRTCDIWAAILKGGYYKGKGKTPYRTLCARLTIDISRHGEGSTFVRRGHGLYELRNQPQHARWSRNQRIRGANLASHPRV